MTHTVTHTNRNGETFEIEIEAGNEPKEADYWGYVISVKDSHSRQKVFRCMIRKTFLEKRSDADLFVTADPLTYVKGLLQETTEGTTPLYWPVTMDWIVI